MHPEYRPPVAMSRLAQPVPDSLMDQIRQSLQTPGATVRAKTVITVRIELPNAASIRLPDGVEVPL